MRISSRKKNKVLFNETHQNYTNKSGKYVPSVTTILKTLSKGDSLMIWANNLGWARKSYRKELDDASQIGTATHTFCEYILTNNNELLIEVDKMLASFSEPLYIKTYNAIQSFKLWYEKHKEDIEVLHIELPLSCENYGGTADFILKYKGKLMIFDFKTSGSYYFSQFLQLSAYAKMYKNMYGEKIEDVAILKLDKKSGKKAKLLRLSKLPNGDLKYYQRVFDKLAELYKFIYVLDNDWNDYSNMSKDFDTFIDE